MIKERGFYLPAVRRGLVTARESTVKPKAKYYSLLIECIDTCSPWVLTPEITTLIKNTTVPQGALDEWRLPFSTMALEYSRPYGEAEGDGPGFALLMQPPIADAIIVAPFFADGADWVLSPLSLTIPLKSLADLNWINIEHDDRVVFDRRAYGTGPDEPHLNVAPVYEREAIENMDDDIVAEFQLLALDCAARALGMLAILRCDPPVKEVLRTTRSSGRKRSKQKPSGRGHRTIHLSDHEKRDAAHGGGGEKSTHWRRGHIRMQRTALGVVRKWIRPTIVRRDKQVNEPDLPAVVLT